MVHCYHFLHGHLGQQLGCFDFVGHYCLEGSDSGPGCPRHCSWGLLRRGRTLLFCSLDLLSGVSVLTADLQQFVELRLNFSIILVKASYHFGLSGLTTI